MNYDEAGNSVVRPGIKIKVDVIGYSRGGLNLYNYMRYDNGVNRVRNWISLGGSNNMSCFGFYGSSSSDPTPGDNTSYTSIYSLTDELVSPDMAIIKGARNISIASASHFTLTTDSEVMSYVLKALQGTGLNNGVALTQPNQQSAPSVPIGLRVISSTDLNQSLIESKTRLGLRETAVYPSFVNQKC